MRRIALGLLLLAQAPAARAAEVVVYAATSLADALQELAAGSLAGLEARFNLAGSNELARQLRAGAPADVFISADGAQMDVVAATGRVRPADCVELLSNRLVVVVPSAGGLRLTAPPDLLRVRRLALADPEAVPAGVYARRSLEALGLWSALRARVLPTLDVRAARAAVETEAAEAGIVYHTDTLGRPRLLLAFELPEAPGVRIAYVAAPLLDARSPIAAAAFMAALGSAQARAIFERHGFVVLARP